MVRLFIWCCLFWLTAAVHPAQPALNLFIWSEYIDPEVIADFEKQFDCRVVMDLYEDDAAMMAKLQAGGASLYDVVVPPDHRVPALVKLGLLAPLRTANLPNLRYLDPKFRSPPYDRENKYSVAYQWGTTGLFVRRTAGEPLPDSWSAVFDATAKAGSFVLIDSPRDLIAAALKYKGHSVNTTQPAHLKEAREVLFGAKSRCLAFDGSVGGKNKVLGKQARLAIVYSGEAIRGMSEDPETAYVIPREGSQIWVDNLVILAGSPRRALAEQFVNYCLDPQVGARISNFTRFATPNQAARAFIRAEDLRNPTIYPPDDLWASLEFTESLGAATRLYDEVWTQVKAK